MSKPSLSEEIKEFRRGKKKWTPILIVLGVLGLILPVLPGAALLFLGFVLLFPREGERFIKRIRQSINLDRD